MVAVGPDAVVPCGAEDVPKLKVKGFVAGGAVSPLL